MNTTDVGRTGPTFDRVGLSFIERYWWREEQASALMGLIEALLRPAAGHAFFRPRDEAWTPVDEESAPAVARALESIRTVWGSADPGDAGGYQRLKQHGGFSVFLDARRFRAWVRTVVDEPRDLSLLPDAFWVGFDIDWSFYDEAGGAVLCPQLRVESQWPASDLWAPEAPGSSPPEPMRAREAAELLEYGFGREVVHHFRAAQQAAGLWPARLDFREQQQEPTYFYHVMPTEPADDGGAYLDGPWLDALRSFSEILLASPDVRSTEITGGILEGCLAAFSHSPGVHSEYCLLLPLAGYDDERLERNINFVARVWHDIDFYASWEIWDILTDLEDEQRFFSLWLDSLSTAMRLNEILFSLLRKPSIQDRMFGLAQLLNGFLANLQARTYAGAKKRLESQRNLEGFITGSRRLAQGKFTVRRIPGVELPGNLSDGYTRAYREFESQIGKAVVDAERLSSQIDDVSESLSVTAALEEQRSERERRQLLAREEKAAKRLNLVLALVAVLAAIPLIVGQFETTTLQEALPWFPFQVGLYFSFGVALLAFVATLVAIILTLSTGRGVGELDSARFTAEVDAHADALFDCYRSYEHPQVSGAILLATGADGDDPDAARDAASFAHGFDLDTARVVARAYERAMDWSTQGDLPADDDEWARWMEARVCQFVLLSDVFDLRPDNLHLPITLCLYRLRFRTVSDWEFNRVMTSRFGYSENDLAALEEWAAEPDVAELSPLEFVDACVDRGVTAAHRLPRPLTHL